MGELSIAVLAGLGAMFGWGVADFFAKKTIDEIGDVVTLVWGHIFGSALMIILLITGLLQQASPQPFVVSPVMLAIVVGFGIAQAIVYSFVYKGFGKGQLVILSPIFSSFSGITALLAIFVLGEVLSQKAGLGAVLLFAGMMIVNTDFTAFKERKLALTKVPGFPEIATATILAAFWLFFWGIVLKEQNWLLYTTIMYISMTAALIIFYKIRSTPLTVTRSAAWKFLVIIGAGEIVAYLAVSIGFSLTNYISIVTLLSSAFSIPAMILAYIFLREKVSRSQLAGAGLLLAGILVLATINV